MKRFMLLLMLFAPFALMAQIDDVYFVPKKEKNPVTVKSTEESFFVDAEEYYEEVGSETDFMVEDASGSLYADTVMDIGNTIVGLDGVSYTNDPKLFYDNNFSYSSRIVRFRAPGRLFGDNLYWDLVYGCGINDWLVYDNGYTLDIYPTVNNPWFYWSKSNRYALGFYNPWNLWRNPSLIELNDFWVYFNWHYNSSIWAHHDYWWRHNNHVHYASRPGRIEFKDVPVNGDIKIHNGERLDKKELSVTANGTRERGGVKMGTLADRRVRINRLDNAEDGSREEENTPSIRKERERRGESATLQNRFRPERDGRVNNLSLRGQQPRRGEGLYTSNQYNNSDKRNGTAVGIRRQQPRRENGLSLRARDGNSNNRSGGATNVRQIRRKSENGYSNGSSSRGYNRPSSTSVSRSRGGSSYSGSETRSGGSRSSYNASPRTSSGNSSAFSGGSSRGGSSGSTRGGRR